MKTASGSSVVAPPLAAVGWRGVVREKLFGISAEEVRFARRGFADVIPGIRERLERVGGAFVTGYNAALRHRGDANALDGALAGVDSDLQGFAHEGAGMGLAIVDLLAPWSRSEWRRFLEGHRKHVYLILIGTGWAMARLFRRTLPRFARDADATLWPLIYDGVGFHQAFFDPHAYVREHVHPKLDGYAANAFDQGVGRSLWFIEGASPERIAATIESFPHARHGDLWSGVGLACAYAGGLDRDGVTRLLSLAAEHRRDLAQGAAFAAKARVEAGNVTPAMELACDVFWRSHPATVADLVDNEFLHAIPCDDREPRYEAWRRRARDRFSS